MGTHHNFAGATDVAKVDSTADVGVVTADVMKVDAQIQAKWVNPGSGSPASFDASRGTQP